MIITDCNVLTKMTIAHNLPDTTFTDEDAVTICLIDMAVPEMHNLREKRENKNVTNTNTS